MNRSGHRKLQFGSILQSCGGCELQYGSTLQFGEPCSVATEHRAEPLHLRGALQLALLVE